MMKGTQELLRTSMINSFGSKKSKLNIFNPQKTLTVKRNDESFVNIHVLNLHALLLAVDFDKQV